jgi:hypothetical protein
MATSNREDLVARLASWVTNRAETNLSMTRTSSWRALPAG